MKKLVCLMLIITLFSLSGCSKNNEQSIDSDTENIGTNNIDDSVKTEDNDKQNSKKSESPEYATDNAGVKGDNQYSSGITIDGVELAEPYKYTGKEYQVDIENEQDLNGDIPIGDIGEQPIESNRTELELELSKYVDVETGEMIIDTMDNETEEEAKIRIQAEIDRLNSLIEEQNKEFEVTTTEYVNELGTLIVDNLYNNGFAILKGVTSVEDFDNDHVIPMKSVIKTLKRNLENIEYCDTLINEQFSSNTTLINSWVELKSKLIECRTGLSDIDTGEKWINAKISEKLDITDEVKAFKSSLDKSSST